ncbi:Bud site selection protein bud4 [Coemansia sp. RSA 552]|nr:Bud site selection protein bud4 [Coemansia sp. RSA 552]
MPFRHHPQPHKTRRPSRDSDSDFDPSDGEDVPESVVGPIEIPKSPSSSSRIGSTPGMKAPTHIDFSASPHSPYGGGSAPAPSLPQKGRFGAHAQAGWPQQLYKQWFGAIVEGRSIQVHSILADHPDVLNMRRREPTPFHMALTHIASEWLGNDTTGMDGLQVAIMGYKNAYANWRLGNGPQTEQMAGMSADQMKEHVAVREVILGALIDAISPEQLDAHFFGRQQNTTLHLAAFYNDANLVERLLRQGAAVDISNHMGFMPSGITNDKPTQQWLAMYRGQVRGSRYPPSPMQPQNFTPESDGALDHFGDSRAEAAAGPEAPLSAPPGDGRGQLAESELGVGTLEHFSDEDYDVSVSSYIKEYADSNSSAQVATQSYPPDDLEHDSASDDVSDDDQGEDVSVVSSNDRSSLGLGGSRPSMGKRSPEGPNLRKRALEGNRRQDADGGRPASRNSTTSYGSEAGVSPLSPPTSSNAPSTTSFHTANGAFSDGQSSPLTPADDDGGHLESGPRSQDSTPNATIRFNMDPASIDENEIDGIFSDEDDNIVQLEPSYCHTGAGLSGSDGYAPESPPPSGKRWGQKQQKPQKQQSYGSSGSSSGSINLQSLNSAMAKAALGDQGAPAISAFPVMVQDSPPRVVDSMGKPLRHVDQMKQQESKEEHPARAASPFMLRDSLYEMIMGRSVSRLSSSSLGSAHSNALSNTSTLGTSREHPQLQQASQTSMQPRSPTSPVSHTSHISPTSTSFDDSNGSPSQTVFSSPTEDVSFNSVIKSSAQQLEAEREEGGSANANVAHTREPAIRNAEADDYSSSESSSDDSGSGGGGDEDEAFDGRSPSPVPAPRPLASSLFAGMGDQPEPDDIHTGDLKPVDDFPSIPQAAPEDVADSLPADISFKAGRIGRRQGRATVEKMVDDDMEDGNPTGTASTFDFSSIRRATDAAVAQDGPQDSAHQEDAEADDGGFGGLPSDAPLTRDKRDQYLQTLINRNTVRNGSPSKRSSHSAMMLAMRSASPAPPSASSDAADSFEDDGGRHSPALGASLRQQRRHVSKRSEGAIDFGSMRGVSALGVPDIGSMPRPASSQHSREALSVSGASISGRMRSSTMASSSVQETPSMSGSRTRKVSPSLASLKTRSLVSNSPAKKTTAAEQSPIGSSPVHTLKFGDSRVRAMSTPVDAQAPDLDLPGASDTASSTGSASGSQYNANTARIGRVAALSQNFERQKHHYSTPPPRIAIPGRMNADQGSLGATSAPLGSMRMNFKRPVTRSSMLMEQVESNESSSSHNSSSSNKRGLAANIGSDSSLAFIGSGSSDLIGSSIFSSTDSKSSSGAEGPLSVSEPARLHAPISSRRETEAERRRRFKELANRRKSGTLERISSSGVVKNRKAMFGPSSDPAIGSPSFKSKRTRVQFSPRVEATDSGEQHGGNTSSTAEQSFLGSRGEERGPSPSHSAATDGPALHPMPAPAGLTRVSSVGWGVDTDTVLERSLRVSHDAASRAVSAQHSVPPAGGSGSSGSDKSRQGSDRSMPGSDRSRLGSASGDDSLHLLSSLDTNSTPGSTPLDSAPADNTKVGLSAQYDMDSYQIERHLDRQKRESGHSYTLSPGQGSPDNESADPQAGESRDTELGFTAKGDNDAEKAEASTSRSQPQADPKKPYDTMMPARPRHNPVGVFGLSTVLEVDEESRNTSLATSGATPQAGSSTLRGLRAALDKQMAAAAAQSSTEHSGSIEVPVSTTSPPDNDSPVSPLGAGVTQEALDAAIMGTSPTSPRAPELEPAYSHSTQDMDSIYTRAMETDDDTYSRAMSLGTHSFDPSMVFGYTSEENNTVASRSSLNQSDISTGRPGSSASRVLYMQPLDAVESDTASTSRAAPRLQEIGLTHRTAGSSGSSSSSSMSYVGKGKEPVRPRRPRQTVGIGPSRKGKEPTPEMTQIQAPDSLPDTTVRTVEEIEADTSPYESPVERILFAESQEFDGYVPIGYKINEYRRERSADRRRKREAARRGETLEEQQPKEMVSPLWFMENSYVDPLPPAELRMMSAKRDRLQVRDMLEEMPAEHVTENPELKRPMEASTASLRTPREELDASTISAQRLREELEAMSTDHPPETVSHGTIKPLAKRARIASIETMFDPPVEDKQEKEPQRRSFLDSVDIPVSIDGSSTEEEEEPGEAEEDPLSLPYISQEFQMRDTENYRSPDYDPSMLATLFQRSTPRRRLVLRPQARTFSERVLGAVDQLDMTVRTDVHGSVRVQSAGQFEYAPAGTVRPSTIPQYVSPLDGVPAGPFFRPPAAAAKAGYLYMRILSIEELEERPSSVYFVIRNGIDTLATTPVFLGDSDSTTTTINQEFRILTDPGVSITMWMRFRSDAIITRSADSMAPPSCMPPLLRRLVRRNTRSRAARWPCSTPADSVFDFAGPRYQPGARRGGLPEPRGPVYPPPRVSSAHVRSANATQQSQHGANDPRSLNATQAPSSVFYEPGGEGATSRKGLAQAQFREETRGVAVVHVGEMLDEVFLRGLVDSWDVENVWEARKGARVHLQMFFIPECPLFREEELPKTLSECEMAMEVCAFHNRTLNSGYLSQRGGDTRFWRRRYFRLIGGFLFAYHEESKLPRCFIDLNDATRIIDRHHAKAGGDRGLMRSQRRSQRPAHRRSGSDHSGQAAGPAAHGGSGYASDSEPTDLVDIADPALRRATLRRRQRQHQSGTHTEDSGVFSATSSDGQPDNAMQHGFSIQFGEGGLIEFYAESAEEKRVWVEIIKRVIGCIPKIPSWLIKLLHADVSDRIDGASPLTSDSSLPPNASTPSSKFQEMAHPLANPL